MIHDVASQSDRRGNARIWSDKLEVVLDQTASKFLVYNLQLPHITANLLMYNLQLPHGHHGRVCHGGHVGHGGHGGRGQDRQDRQDRITFWSRHTLQWTNVNTQMHKHTKQATCPIEILELIFPKISEEVEEVVAIMLDPAQGNIQRKVIFKM